MKIMLSIPKTISKKVRVSKDNNPSGLKRTSIVLAAIRF
jgi:hypothetical protein